jgi:hypothetical protein
VLAPGGLRSQLTSDSSDLLEPAPACSLVEAELQRRVRRREQAQLLRLLDPTAALRKTCRVHGTMLNKGCDAVSSRPTA